MTKIKNHFLNKRNYYYTATIITLLLLVIYAIFGAFPFGSKTIAHYDMLHQIAPFLNLIQEAIDGSGTIFFSNKLGGGANVFGFLCYFIFSPVYLFVLLFGKNNVLYALNFAFILQVVAIALTFLWFIRKYFNLTNVNQILLSIGYAFSMYVLFNYTFLSWLFLVMLMPIFAHNFINLVKHGKIWGLTFTIVLMIFNCYGVGMCGQFITFILCTVYIFTLVPKFKRKTSMAKLLLSFGLALAVSLFMLGPNALQLGDSSRLGGSITTNFIEKGLLSNLPTGIAFLLLNASLFALCLYFVLTIKKQSKYSQFLLVALLLNVIPFLIDGITLVLTLGGYIQYQTRMCYVLNFVMFMCGIVALKNIDKKEETVKPEKFTERSILTWAIVGIVIEVVICILLYYALSAILCEGRIPNESFLLIIAMCTMIVFALTYAVIQLRNNKISKKFFKNILLIIFCFQYLLNPIMFTGMGYMQTTKCSFIMEQSKNLNVKYDRLKDFDETLGTNIQLLSDFSSYSCFASQIHKNVAYTGMGLGYNSGSNYFASAGGTVLSDSFLGFKYFYSQTKLDRPYLTLIDKQDAGKHNGNDTTLYLYENNLVLNGSILVDKNKSLVLYKNGFVGTQSLYEYLGGNDMVITQTNLKDAVFNNNVTVLGGKLDNENQIISYDKSSNQDYITTTINISKSNYNKIVYLSFKVDTDNYDKMFGFNYGDFANDCMMIHGDMFYDVGFVNENQDFTVDISFYEDVNYDEITVYELNYDKVEQLLLQIKQQNVEFEYTKTGFKANVTASENQKLIVTNTNIKGNYITNNGKVVTPNDLYLIELDLENGENIIESTFKFPYVKTVVLALIVGVVALVAVFVINKWLLKYNIVTNTLYYISMGVFGVFVGLVYLLPCAIFVVRLCLFKF